MTATPVTPRAEIDVVRAALAAEYDVVEELGRGGMAIVYRGVERAAGREVAIKVLPAQFAFDESFVERFQREGRIAARLEHPHIVPVYRVGRTGPVIWFTMKLLRGESLADRLRARARLGAGETRRVLMETASALGYAAQRGVVHRDVKPDNIMFDDEGRCVVADFGIARSASESKLTATGMSVGTPRYMSPEQARSKPLDGRSDIYSLGIVGYECLVGDTPFHGEDAFAVLMKHIRTPVPRPALGSAEEWDLFDVIERMLAKEPADRYQTADELIAALGGSRSATGRGVAYVPRPAAATPTRPVAIVRDDRPRAAAPDEPSGPQSSAALDRALEVGFDMLRRQKPKLDAGLTAGRDLVIAQQPRIAAARTRLAIGLATGASYLRARTKRFWSGIAASVFFTVAAYYGVHFATKHRTRCVTPAVADSGRAARPRSFSVMLDAVGAQSAGDDLDVYYDVCGLAPATAYTASVRVQRNESGLKRLFGRGVGPVTRTWDEDAQGPAVRHHRTLRFDAMPPGSYTLRLVVTDAKGRVRERESSFQVEP